MPKYNLGQIVKYELEKDSWYFIITEILSPPKHKAAPYYRCYCFKAPDNHVQIRDLHCNIQMSEILLDAV